MLNLLAHRMLVVKVLVMIALTVIAVFAFSDGPPPGFTGSLTFGEPNCTLCHSSFDVNSGRDLGGTFDILDIPGKYTPGETYTITVQLAHPGQQRWGFELAARFADTGDQAGTLTRLDPDNTQIQDFNGIQYLSQTGPGTYAGTADGPVQWQFNWTAPDSGTVVFSAAGNAADYDNGGTPQGDYIYTTEQCTGPAEDNPSGSAEARREARSP